MKQDTIVQYDTYLRKSQEPDDRQVLSIPAQKAECADRFFELVSVHTIEESFSAKAPGRPLFNQLLDRVDRGEIQGIIAWHPDRLARNSVDAGRIIYLLDTGKLKDIKFCSYTFENTPEGKWMLSMVMSQAKYQVDKLSVDVKRGNRQKWDGGGITWRAPLGYVNAGRRHSDITPDPERFVLVRKMWDLLLSGAYTVSQIQRIANNDWGMRSRITKKTGGGPLALSSLYRMFRSPLYCGINIRPDGSEYRCVHTPMITDSEFWRAQAILGKKGRSRPKLTFWPYGGSLVRCGECGCAITGESKTKHFKNGRSAHYTYYRCTKKRGACSQRYLAVDKMEDQILSKLQRIKVTKHRQAWIERHFETRRQDNIVEQQAVDVTKRRTIEEVGKELRNLSRMLRKELIDEADYVAQRSELMAERGQLAEDSHPIAVDPLEPMRKSFDFAFQSCYWLLHGSPAQRRVVVEKIFGSNLSLKDKTLSLEPVGPFEIMAGQDQYLTWCAFAEDIRTYFIKNGDNLNLPDLAALAPLPRSEQLLQDVLGQVEGDQPERAA